ncbi:odorant receptor 67c-like [Rhynchophorus ferrugineus]|uniref:odorant receptor 67c-like n=1 Tax=Rhynchophorus ferrugineus TaxID=354439 RepID=UPI003FCD0A37
MLRGDRLFQIAKILMLIAGTWRLELKELPNKWQMFYNIYSVFIQISFNTFVISFLIELYMTWGIDNDKAVECLTTLIVNLVFVVKMGLFQTKKMTKLLNQIIDHVNCLSIDDEHGEYIFESHLRYNNILNIGILIYTFSLGLHLNIIGLVQYVYFQQEPNNVTESADKPIILMYWYPFDYNKHYGFVIFYQFFTIFASDLYNSAIQAMFNTIIIQLSSDLKMLQLEFQKFNMNMKESKQKLKNIIVKHQKIIEYIEGLNETLKYPLLIEYMVSSVMFASVLVQILQGKKIIFNVEYFVIMAFQLFILSWNANEIKIQSEHIAYSIYESKWYEDSTEVKKMLYIVVMRCRKPLSLNIGPFGSLTNDAFLSRIKLAYSYVSLLSGGVNT